MNVYISPLNPINFTDKNDEKSGELERSYVQQFVSGDIITLQVLTTTELIRFQIGEKIFASIRKTVDGKIINYNNIETSELPSNELLEVKIIAFSSNETKTYTATNLIEIVPPYDNLKLIEYTNNSNISAFDTYFDGFKFSLRLPVGFKSTSIKNRLASETFRNQNQELKILYSAPYQTQTLIIGDSMGVPTWMAKLFNSIFCLSDITIDGEKYVRSDDSVPEKVGGIEGYPLHIYQMEVEKVNKNIEIEISNINEDFNEDFQQ